MKGNTKRYQNKQELEREWEGGGRSSRGGGEGKEERRRRGSVRREGWKQREAGHCPLHPGEGNADDISESDLTDQPHSGSIAARHSEPTSP